MCHFINFFICLEISLNNKVIYTERERERERDWVASTCQTCSNYSRMASAEWRATGEHGLSVYYRKRFVASIYSTSCMFQNDIINRSWLIGISSEK